jgi:5-methyltetrahydropteroyltriglutamate--homocysteine methyltransferase
MRRSEQRILTTHTGSLPRPPELVRRYQQRYRGEAVDPNELSILSAAIVRDVVHRQRVAGIESIICGLATCNVCLVHETTW